MRRVLCVWLPRWPIQRLRHERAELEQTPLILYAPSRGRMAVAFCSPQAGKERVRPGMPLAEAHAILGPATPVRCEPHDADADRLALRRWAVWCQCFTPLVALEEPDSLFLDITGCGPLFGGEQKLAATVVDRWRQHGLVARVAVADTAGAAWALAHHHPANGVVMPPGQHRPALRSLPVEALRLAPEVVQLLREFDIVRVEQLQQLPRSVLPARFGARVLRRLDEALGDLAEPLVPVLANEPLAFSWPLENPTTDRWLVEKVLTHLLEQVLAKLRPRQLGVRRLLCKLHSAEGAPHALTVGLLHASASLDYLLGMIRLHLERIRWGPVSNRSEWDEHGAVGNRPPQVTMISLHAAEVVPLEFRQEMLFDHDARTERWRQFPALVELLSNRLGKEAVLRPRLCADAQPELAWRYEPWLEHRDGSQSLRLQWPTENLPHKGRLVRPVHLKARPVAIAALSAGPPVCFEWSGRGFTVVRFWGPERIHTGWWRGQDVRRDYYLVETAAGERFWLFRTTDAWFLHGMFA